MKCSDRAEPNGPFRFSTSIRNSGRPRSICPRERCRTARISYHYLLRNADGSVVEDWDDKRINPASCRHEELLVIDSWNGAGFFENAFYTEPFQQVLLKANHTEVRVASPATATHTFKVKAPLLDQGPDPLPAGRVRRAGPLEHGEPPAPEPDRRGGFSHRGTGPQRTILSARLQIRRL